MTEIGDQQRKLLHLNNKSQSFESGLGTLENMQQHILGNVDEGMTRLSNDMVTLGNTTKETENLLMQADTMFKNLHTRMSKVEEEGTPERQHQGKGLLDPEIMTVNNFDGDKIGEYVGWRDALEKLVNEFHPGLRAVLKAVRKHKSKITET